MHKLLARQLKRHLGALASDPRLDAFLAAVEAAYQQSDADRALLERSLELTSEELNDRYVQLLTAKDTAEAASHAKTAFLANMSHEIRTPMNGVLGMIQLALDLELSRELRDLLDTAKSSAEHLLAILNDVLDVSKIEAQRMELESSAFDVRGVIAEIFRSFGLAAYKSGLDLIGLVDPEVPWLLVGDPLRLRQIATNLIGNALKFTEHGQVIVSLRFRADQLSLDVEDSGIGIAASKLERIFESFAQADTSMSRRFGGTGLGLAISARLSELMGGALTVESSVGKGSTFRARMKMGSEGSSPARDPSRASIPAGSLLIVEDNRRVAQELAAALAAEGHVVELASSLEATVGLIEARRLLRRPYDAVLIDGDLLASEERTSVREISDGHERFILMSSPFDTHALGAELPAAAICMKPISSFDLSRVVSEVIGERVQHRRDDVARDPASSPDVSGLSVLLAEDNPINQKLMVRMLERRGLRVAMVADGRAVLEALAREHFDLILMDISMPEIDGLEACRRIRKSESETGRARVPIIALTAHTMPGDADQCAAAGMDAYVSKPVDVKKLFEHIRVLVERSADRFEGNVNAAGATAE